ncbi:SMI1/KNR4 family protein [Acinetobacter sp. C26M]|uniref:SMI1/KNR4 family protein n=1 Tax=unclassified Acinetobacter TaxID=196816 RepID=UPI002036BE4C|nr:MULTISPECIES: SMI1/KNR4 family protein [unclassified Acinetobacter]USA45403.1 SMI1/KNR4 family protein [Acinetobacter sp. C26M]USA48905.1 SMI1/KNR4 family protein [Acinetobacter sp. C26G]
MSIDDLVKEMLPPKEPSEVPNNLNNQLWDTIESKLGLVIPNDYKEFIQIYGSGSIDSFLTIFNPFSENININLIDQLYVQSEVYKDLKSYGEEVPYDFFPLKNGILPFGMTDNGDVLFWQVNDLPKEWNVIINEARSSNWDVLKISMTDFLLGILQRKVVCNFFPSTFPSKEPSFEQF